MVSIGKSTHRFPRKQRMPKDRETGAESAARKHVVQKLDPDPPRTVGCQADWVGSRGHLSQLFTGPSCGYCLCFLPEGRLSWEVVFLSLLAQPWLLCGGGEGGWD